MQIDVFSDLRLVGGTALALQIGHRESVDIDLFGFYLEKFDDGNLFLVKKSLAYFDDAEPEPMPVMKEKIDWVEIKEYVQKNILPFI